MAPNVLLITPWIYDFTAFDLWAKPLGLLKIAASLNHVGYSVGLIDCLYQQGFSTKRKRFGANQYHAQEIERPQILNNIPRKYKRFGISHDEFNEQIKKIPPHYLYESLQL